MLKHVLIIPDGNRRYANKKDIDIGVVYKFISDDITTKLIKYLIIEKKISEMSFFAISRDNVLHRTKKELHPIFDAQIDAYDNWLRNPALTKHIKFNFVGDFSLLPKDYVNKAKELENKTKNNKNGILNLLVAYDSEWEIFEATKKVSKLKDFSESDLKKNLLIKTPIDLIIRTGGEVRLSGCPIFPSKYAELVFIEKFYPELTSEALDEILKNYNLKNRRFGK